MGYCELHAHLGGSVPFSCLYEIGKRSGHRLGSYHEFMHKYGREIDGVDDYFKRYEIIEPIQAGPEAVRLSAYHSFVYAYTILGHDLVELRFNPCFRNSSDLLDIDSIIIASINGAQDASDIYGIKAGIILCLDHRLPEKANKAIIEKASKYKNRGIIGLDLAGPEHSARDVDKLFKLAKLMDKSGLKYTIHFGESPFTAGKLGELFSICTPDRIGHAISSLFNDNDLDNLKLWSGDNCVEFCPKSNIMTGAAFQLSGRANSMEGLINLAIQRWYKEDIDFCVCTDAPVLLRTSVEKQLKYIKNEIILDFIMENAETNSFIEEAS